MLHNFSCPHCPKLISLRRARCSAPFAIRKSSRDDLGSPSTLWRDASRPQREFQLEDIARRTALRDNGGAERRHVLPILGRA